MIYPKNGIKEMDLRYSDGTIIQIYTTLTSPEGKITAYNKFADIVYADTELDNGVPCVWYKQKFNEDNNLIFYEDSCGYWEKQEWFEGEISYCINSDGIEFGRSRKEITKAKLRIVK